MPTDPTYPTFTDAELTEWANMLRAYDHEYFTLATADLRQLFVTLDQRTRERDDLRAIADAHQADKAQLLAERDEARGKLARAVRGMYEAAIKAVSNAD